MSSEIEQLREENRRLRELLERHGIVDPAGRVEHSVLDQDNKIANTSSALTTQQKIALFRELFRGVNRLLLW